MMELPADITFNYNLAHDIQCQEALRSIIEEYPNMSEDVFWRIIKRHLELAGGEIDRISAIKKYVRENFPEPIPPHTPNPPTPPVDNDERIEGIVKFDLTYKQAKESQKKHAV